MKLRNKLSQYWGIIQGNFSPWWQEELGSLAEKQQRLITVLAFARVEEFIDSYKGCVGRFQEDRCVI